MLQQGLEARSEHTQQRVLLVHAGRVLASVEQQALPCRQLEHLHGCGPAPEAGQCEGHLLGPRRHEGQHHAAEEAHRQHQQRVRHVTAQTTQRFASPSVSTGIAAGFLAGTCATSTPWRPTAAGGAAAVLALVEQRGTGVRPQAGRLGQRRHGEPHAVFVAGAGVGDADQGDVVAHVHAQHDADAAAHPGVGRLASASHGGGLSDAHHHARHQLLHVDGKALCDAATLLGAAPLGVGALLAEGVEHVALLAHAPAATTIVRDHVHAHGHVLVHLVVQP